ncbi:hypothetical protein ABW21_db0208261 [Orbilia brochopaga]|nr:hypothetical protein ABW21_db0208261 [Drechslerella brochopaga]
MILRRLLVLGHLRLLYILRFPTAEAQASVALPLCAVNCLSEALLQSSCFQTDTRCLCQSRGYIDASVECIDQVCNALDRKQAYQYSQENCKAAGIVLSLPGSSSTTTGASTSTTSTSASTTSASNKDATTTSDTQIAKETGTSTGATPAAQTGSSSSTNIGPIVGGVVGGIAVIALILVGVWLVMRERRRRRFAMGTPLPSTPAAQPDMNSQGIWTGEGAYSWNPPQGGLNEHHGGIEGR